MESVVHAQLWGLLESSASELLHVSHMLCQPLDLRVFQRINIFFFFAKHRYMSYPYKANSSCVCRCNFFYTVVPPSNNVLLYNWAYCCDTKQLFPSLFLGDCIHTPFKLKAIITLTGCNHLPLQVFFSNLSIILKYQAVMHIKLTMLSLKEQCHGILNVCFNLKSWFEFRSAVYQVWCANA